ncbi:hypothetical protein Agub_g13489 [Astrephomene gubernaculifera]|uniref:DUF7796 domain-containing protein n=1 Tax=Astrephomene gubernaculifera TaxID=47775 RepID=A0AAD3DZX9_9CHLO|nr:hypothetical protein Agub_g13489 [Astrephomene gubernaculifera]
MLRIRTYVAYWVVLGLHVLVSTASPSLLPDGGRQSLLWRHPIVGKGATSGEVYRPLRFRRFKLDLLPNEVPRPVSPLRQQRNCSHWIVTTTINVASPNLQALANMTGWCKVIVLDRKSPADFNLRGPGLVILTVTDQEGLGWKGMDRIPWNHFGRKNVGFMYAAVHGAQVIYDTDDDNIVLDNSAAWLPRSFRPEDGSMPELVSPTSGDIVFNPYPFWGVPGAWPRGFPLSLIDRPTTSNGVRPAKLGENGHPDRICVLQSLANADPDMDAIWRLTRELPLYFRPLNSWLAYPSGTYAPWNAQATLISAELIAGMALPVTVHGRVSDIWRSYILQRAMWGLGCGLAFSAPWVTQYRNAHAYLKDFQAELDLYLKTEGLLQVLNAVDLDGTTAGGPHRRLERLGARVLTLYIALYEHGLLEGDDVLMLYSYLTDLGQLTATELVAVRAVLSAPSSTAVAVATSQPAVPSQQQRAAVCVTGQFRGGPFPWTSIQRNVLNALDMAYDVFVVSPAEYKGQAASDFLYQLKPHVVLHPDYAIVEELIKLDGWDLTGFTAPHNPKKWLFQIADLKVCADAIKNSSITYTHAVRVRADSMVLTRLPEAMPKLQVKDVVVPANESFEGVNDRFAYGGIDAMMSYLTVLDVIPGMLADLVAKKDPPPASRNAEGILQAQLERNKVVALPRVVMLCRLEEYVSGKLRCDEHDYATFPECKQACDELSGRR